MRKAGKIALIGLGLLGIVVPAALYLMTRQEPPFYRNVASMPPAQRAAARHEFLTQTSQLVSDIHNETSWSARYTRDQVNAWLESEFPAGASPAEQIASNKASTPQPPALSTRPSNLAPTASASTTLRSPGERKRTIGLGLKLPSGVRDPRVSFEPEAVKLAFKLDGRPISAIVWVQLRIRVPKPNLIAVEIADARVGLLPLPRERILDRVDSLFANLGLEVEWNENAGKPVALIFLPPKLVGPHFELDRITIEPAGILVAGLSPHRARARLQSAASETPAVPEVVVQKPQRSKGS